MPSRTWVFVVLADTSLRLWHLFKISKPLFCPSYLLWTFCEGACQRSMGSQLSLASMEWGLPCSSLQSPSDTFLSLFCSLLCASLFPCLSFQRPECVAPPSWLLFPLGDKKEGKGVPQGGRNVGKETMGHTGWGGMEVRALITCGAPNFKAVFAKQEPKHRPWAQDCRTPIGFSVLCPLGIHRNI